jgi:hypothetical protein
MTPLNLAINADKTYQVTVPNIPIGLTVTKAWFAVKVNQTDSDDDAVVFKTITAVESSEGQIINSGTNGVAVVQFVILSTDTASMLTNTTYISAVKVLFSNGLSSVPAGSLRPTYAINEIIQVSQ